MPAGEVDVLVVGGGKSGAQIAANLLPARAAVAHAAHHAARSLQDERRWGRQA